MITEHAVCALPADHPDWRHLVIRVQRRGSTDRWVLNHCGYYLTVFGRWEPSMADAMHLPEAAALDAAEGHALLVEVNGLTAADLLNR